MALTLGDAIVKDTKEHNSSLPPSNSIWYQPHWVLTEVYSKHKQYPCSKDVPNKPLIRLINCYRHQSHFLVCYTESSRMVEPEMHSIHKQYYFYFIEKAKKSNKLTVGLSRFDNLKIKCKFFSKQNNTNLSVSTLAGKRMGKSGALNVYSFKGSNLGQWKTTPRCFQFNKSILCVSQANVISTLQINFVQIVDMSVSILN
jgi:hypothetical protein